MSESKHNAAPNPADRTLNRAVFTSTLARLFVNIGHRMVYPFLPAIARGLHVPIESAGVLVTVLLATGLASPLFGSLSDRFGRRRIMAIGLAIVALGAVFIALVPHFPAIIVGFGLLGIGKVLFDPALRAYLGDTVPYSRRGWALAITELSWAGGLLVGAPVAGWVIGRWGWQVAFGGVAVLVLVGMLGVLLGLPRSERRAGGSNGRFSLRAVRQLVSGPRSRPLLAALAVTWLVMLGHELLYVVYGAWLESGYGLSIGRLGLVTIVVGAAELLGELGASRLVDRLGKRRAIAAGLALTALGYIAWPLAANSLVTALLSLFVLMLCFEFAFVATLPLITELVPAARATTISLNAGVDGIGRVIGASLALPLWSTVGLWGNGLVASATTLLAVGVLLAWVRVDEPAAAS